MKIFDKLRPTGRISLEKLGFMKTIFEILVEWIT